MGAPNVPPSTTNQSLIMHSKVGGESVVLGVVVMIIPVLHPPAHVRAWEVWGGCRETQKSEGRKKIGTPAHVRMGMSIDGNCPFIFGKTLLFSH